MYHAPHSCWALLCSVILGFGGLGQTVPNGNTRAIAGLGSHGPRQRLDLASFLAFYTRTSASASPVGFYSFEIGFAFFPARSTFPPSLPLPILNPPPPLQKAAPLRQGLLRTWRGGGGGSPGQAETLFSVVAEEYTSSYYCSCSR